jgi:hypothetical protein
MVRSLAVVATTLVSVLVGGPAFADCNAHGDGDDQGSQVTTVGSGISYQTGLWDKPGKRIRLVAATDTAMSPDRCHDVYVDWAVATSDHYDLRMLRNCDPGSYRETDATGDGYSDEPSDWGNRNVTGMQKSAACSYVQSTHSFNSSCVQYDENIFGCAITAAFDIPLPTGHRYARWFVRWENGTVDYDSGGIVGSATS